MLSKDQVILQELDFQNVLQPVSLKVQKIEAQKKQLADWYKNAAGALGTLPFGLESAFKDPNVACSRWYDYEPPFRVACGLGLLELVEFLFKEYKAPCLSWTHEDSNSIIDEEPLALRACIVHSKMEVLSFLLENGFNPCKTGPY